MKEQLIELMYLQFMVYFLSFIMLIFICVYIEHTANCLTHGCLIIPSFIAAQNLISRAKTPEQYWSSIIYGNALIFLFSFSTVFHCSCLHPTYRYERN
jgi:monocyte-to-macrophage differentiation protein